jgi:hypothetical protein
MLTQTNLKDLELVLVRPEAEPRAVQVDAWLGDLYLGQRTFYASTIKEAHNSAVRIINQHGSLN